MKPIKWLLTTGVITLAFTAQSFAQQTLPEVTVLSRNYKYLKSVNSSEAAPSVQLLERKAAVYDVKSSEYFEDDYDSYYITFYMPQGYVLAVYDSTGKLLRTAERFKNVAVPAVVRTAVSERFPNWGITEGVYRVSYVTDGAPRMDYKLVLQNGNKRMRVKMNEKGEFL